jgi:hypothetical protein
MNLSDIRNWINGLNIKTGKSPSGMSMQYGYVKAIAHQLNVADEFYNGDINKVASNINWYLEHLTDEDIIKLTDKLTKENKGIAELQLKNADYNNHSIMSEKKFIQLANEIDLFLSTLTGVHKKSLSPRLIVVFVKKQDSAAKAKYKSKEDMIYIRPDRATPGDAYASFNYIMVHELGHRYLSHNKVNFDYDASHWITTPYSRTDSMIGEEKFAELFALSHFNYTGKPFDSYDKTIQRFNSEMKGNNIKENIMKISELKEFIKSVIAEETQLTDTSSLKIVINGKLSFLNDKKYGKIPNGQPVFDYILNMLFYNNRNGTHNYSITIDGKNETNNFKKKIKDKYKNIPNTSLRDSFFTYANIK